MSTEKLMKPAKVIREGKADDWSSELDRNYVKEFMGKIGVVVDCSDSHGVCYGMVFPNTEGNYGRKEKLPVYWFNPDEINFEFDHTGFVVRYNDEFSIEERNNFFDKKLNQICATNWHHVEKPRIKTLEIWWHGELKGKIDPPTKSPEKDGIEWLFYHTGSIVLGDPHLTGDMAVEPQSVTLSRTIGIKGKTFEKTYTVNEVSGELKTTVGY